ncbi:S1 family peptidase [Devosia sp. SL43]|uniref:S1 family peptidase n=1 Tax=Devosia sp. SL43 TaxID=2806348 RepID=UPI001F253DEC|nr:serine protease [Devosia sp. SL43]UJW86729.1 trypsin-like peptidase domain-containing protein [Devosia sp. SL43]
MKPELLEPLKGADDPSRYWSHDKDGVVGDGKAMLVPILTYRSPGPADFRFLGTGFFIAPGIVATAKHVIEAFEPGRFPLIFQFEQENQVSMRRVHEICVHKESDVGILRVLGEKPNHTNKCAVLTSRKPQAGSLAFTSVVANTKVWADGPGQSIAMNVENFRGKVVQQFPTGRDRVMLPWPCYQVDFHLHGGGSGGPVFDAGGEVFAINCASHTPETDIAFVTSVDMLLGCIIQNIVIENKSYTTATIRDLVDAGIVLYT